MKINTKTLQVTLVETAGDVDVNTKLVVQEQLALNELQQVTVVEVTGEVDIHTAPLVQEQILPLTQAGTKMILDMTKVPYMSSAGLRMLLSLYRQIFANSGQIVLVGLSEEIKDTMSMTGFLDFFKTCDTLDSALVTLNVKVYVTSA